MVKNNKNSKSKNNSTAPKESKTDYMFAITAIIAILAIVIMIVMVSNHIQANNQGQLHNQEPIMVVDENGNVIGYTTGVDDKTSSFEFTMGSKF